MIVGELPDMIKKLYLIEFHIGFPIRSSSGKDVQRYLRLYRSLQKAFDKEPSLLLRLKLIDPGSATYYINEAWKAVACYDDWVENNC